MISHAAAASRWMVPSVALSWCAIVVALLWTAHWNRSVMAWTACAIVAVMPALVLMVLAHSPAKTVAEILRDVERG